MPGIWPVKTEKIITKSDTETTPGTLFDLGIKYSTDKITRHRYDRYFEPNFQPSQNEEINLFEIGVDNKKSLALWLSYFPDAMVYGLDIDLAFEADRYKVFRDDQSGPDILKDILNETGRCHIIIDDGSHVPEHQLACFNYLFDTGILRCVSHQHYLMRALPDGGFSTLLAKTRPLPNLSERPFKKLHSGHSITAINT